MIVHKSSTNSGTAVAKSVGHLFYPRRHTLNFGSRSCQSLASQTKTLRIVVGEDWGHCIWDTFHLQRLTKSTERLHAGILFYRGKRMSFMPQENSDSVLND